MDGNETSARGAGRSVSQIVGIIPAGRPGSLLSLSAKPEDVMSSELTSYLSPIFVPPSACAAHGCVDDSLILLRHTTSRILVDQAHKDCLSPANNQKITSDLTQRPGRVPSGPTSQAEMRASCTKPAGDHAL
jgi:hypothetical protein